MILRRSVILALGSMPLLARGVFSQTAVKARRVGLLSTGAPFTDTSPVVVGLTAGFSKRGYVVGSSLLFERRAAEAHADRLPRLVDDLKSQAELIITNAYAAARVIKDRSNAPVVAITGADPVVTGLIDSLARPGGMSLASAKLQPSFRPSGWRSSKILFRTCARLPCCGTQTILG